MLGVCRARLVLRAVRTRAEELVVLEGQHPGPEAVAESTARETKAEPAGHHRGVVVEGHGAHLTQLVERILIEPAEHLDDLVGSEQLLECRHRGQDRLLVIEPAEALPVATREGARDLTRERDRRRLASVCLDHSAETLQSRRDGGSPETERTG